MSCACVTNDPACVVVSFFPLCALARPMKLSRPPQALALLGAATYAWICFSLSPRLEPGPNAGDGDQEVGKLLGDSDVGAEEALKAGAVNAREDLPVRLQSKRL